MHIDNTAEEIGKIGVADASIIPIIMTGNAPFIIMNDVI